MTAMRVSNPATTFATAKPLGATYNLTAAAVTSLGALTAASTVADALQVLSTVTKAQHEVDTNQIGYATSTEA